MDHAETPKKLGASYWKLLVASTISNLGDGVGLIAYPWLASAITRNPILIALVAVLQKLPWLLFSLPAGVITDRFDRRTLMMRANVARGLLTLVVALVVLGRQGVLPGPDEVEAGVAGGTDFLLYGMILTATFLLGMAEVIYDNAGQTLMPSVVDKSLLEKANGRLWSVEQVANTFIGPPLGAALLVIAFAVPFFFDAVSFLAAALLIAFIPTVRRSAAPEKSHTSSWREELTEGFSWLWNHPLLRSMAIILGLLNMLWMVVGAVLVLFAQEILETTPTEFALLGTGGAVGGVLGGWLGAPIVAKIGPGRCLALTFSVGSAVLFVIGLSSLWPVAWVMIAIYTFVGTLWNVITVSLRQSIIPDHLLGRVNSVYRFFAWGMMPIGALLGGLIIVVTESLGSRELALRMPWFVAGFAQLVLFIVAAPKLTTFKLEAARTAAAAE